ncbi:MAG: sugar ABC transporter substrate-binding protein [Deltaproteobacteria bacterium]|nr:sugar ABC transporter substrate-binding protein [Deltaproteobacteria bacterium]
MRNKRTITFLSVFFLITFFCSFALGAEKPRLVFWSPSEFVPEWNETVKRQVEEFCKKEGAIADITFIAWSDVEPKLAAAIEAGTPPDIHKCSTGLVGFYQAAGALVDVTDVYKKIGDRLGGWYPTASYDVTFNGRQWGIPDAFQANAMYYRKDLLDKAGVGIPGNLNEFLEVAKKVNDPSEGIYALGFPLSTSGDSLMTWRAFLWSFGGKLVEEDGKTLAFDSEETLKALTFYTDLYNKYKLIPPGATAWDNAGNNRAYLTGTCAIVYNTGSILYKMRADQSELLAKTQIAPFPGIGCNQVFSWGVFKKGKNNELAKKLLLYLFEKEQYEKRIKAGATQSQPTLRAMADMEMWKDPYNLAMLKASENTHVYGYAGPVLAPAIAVSNARVMEEMVGRVVVDKWTPRAALDEAMKRIRDIYKAYK